MEHVLLLGILDSFRAMREIPPLISTKDKTKYNTRKRWRWQAGKTNRETLEAREWVENELPKYWNCVFARSSSVVLAWARHVWSEIDRDPKAEETYRTMVSQALIPAAGNGKRNPDA